MEFLSSKVTLQTSVVAAHNNGQRSVGLFNPVEKNVYELDFPEAHGKLFKGSSRGWVVTIEDVPSSNPADMYLINPLTKAKIQLPPRSTFPDVKEYHAHKVGQEYVMFHTDGSNKIFVESAGYINNLIEKVVLSSDPSCDDFVAVAIYGGITRLAYCKCNDKKWTPLSIKCFTKDPIDELPAFEDVIFHKGKLYALSCWGRLVVYEDISVNPNVTELVAAVKPPHYMLTTHKYLVESTDGELLVVARGIDVDDGKGPFSIIRTCGFVVYKLDLNNSNWVEVKSIGDNVLFVGCNSSMSISSLDFLGYQGNCIYFTDGLPSFAGNERGQENSDIGVFRLEDGTFNSLPGFKCESRFIWPLPIWLMPPSSH